jgi:predicted nuclease of predicted toxin-antitoxin system
LKFLVDQPISWEIARDLRALGHDAVHVRDLGMAAEDDRNILQRAFDDGRVVVTQDTDYGTLLFTAQVRPTSVILFRMRDGRPSAQSAVLCANVPRLEADLNAGAIIVIGDASIRIRRLGPG